MLTAVANGKWCGGGFKSCPKASLQDGLMDIGVVRPVKGMRFLRLFLKYRAGTHLQDKEADKYVKYMQLSKFTIKPKNEFNVSIDGEVFKFPESNFEVIPGAISFVVPEGSEII